jgi:hypothetical protein
VSGDAVGDEEEMLWCQVSKVRVVGRGDDGELGMWMSDEFGWGGWVSFW